MRQNKKNIVFIIIYKYRKNQNSDRDQIRKTRRLRYLTNALQYFNNSI